MVCWLYSSGLWAEEGEECEVRMKNKRMLKFENDIFLLTFS